MTVSPPVAPPRWLMIAIALVLVVLIIATQQSPDFVALEQTTPSAKEPTAPPVTEPLPQVIPAPSAAKETQRQADDGPAPVVAANEPSPTVAKPSPAEERPTQPQVTPTPKKSQTSATERGPPEKSAAAARIVVKNVTIKDQSGRTVHKGDIDLTPTLARIERGERHEHRNDGSTFRNLEGRLPKQPAGYYKEYVHPTPGIGGPGPQRIVIGQKGEAYYTHDHYGTFKKVRS
jgi:ribonuclease T1